MARSVVELGFTPTSRSKVIPARDARPPVQPNDPADEMPSLDDYLAKGERLRARAQAELAKKH
jgi:hypothetical protein